LLDANHPVFQLLIGFPEFFDIGFQVIVYVVLTTWSCHVSVEARGSWIVLPRSHGGRQNVLANVLVHGPAVFCDWARQDCSLSYVSLWLLGNQSDVVLFVNRRWELILMY
jgi:hypothetical protein